MQEYWSSLTSREKTLIMVAGGLSIVVLLYLAVFKPLVSYQAESAARFKAAQQLHQQIVNGASVIAAHQGDGAAVTASNSRSQPLRVSVATAARATGVAISRLQPAENGALTVWVESVAAGELYRWMTHMAEENGITPTKVLAQKSSSAGRLRVQLQFTGR